MYLFRETRRTCGGTLAGAYFPGEVSVPSSSPSTVSPDVASVTPPLLFLMPMQARPATHDFCWSLMSQSFCLIAMLKASIFMLKALMRILYAGHVLVFVTWEVVELWRLEKATDREPVGACCQHGPQCCCTTSQVLL